MNWMDPVFLFAGMFVFFMAGKRKLLVRKESYRFIFWIAVELFVMGVIFHFTKFGRDSACGAFLAPLPTLLLFRLLRRIFVARYNREPVSPDAPIVIEREMPGIDRLFNLACVILAMVLFIFTTVLSLELAKAGW